MKKTITQRIGVGSCDRCGKKAEALHTVDVGAIGAGHIIAVCPQCIGYWESICKKFFQPINAVLEHDLRSDAKERKVGMKTLALAFREVIEAAYPTPDSKDTPDTTIVKMLCDWGRQSCDELDKISRQRDLLLEASKEAMNALIALGVDGFIYDDKFAVRKISQKIVRNCQRAIAEVEK